MATGGVNVRVRKQCSENYVPGENVVESCVCIYEKVIPLPPGVPGGNTYEFLEQRDAIDGVCPSYGSSGDGGGGDGGGGGGGGDDSNKFKPEVIPPDTFPSNVATFGTRNPLNKGFLHTEAANGSNNELWIGIDTWQDRNQLEHDYDRPYLGDGLFDTVPPTRPRNLRVVQNSMTETSFVVAWDPSADDIYVQRYELDVATDVNFQNLLAGYSARSVGRATEAGIVGLQPQSRYFWRVRAVDSSNNYSAWASNTAFRPYTKTNATRFNLSRNPSFEDGTEAWIPIAVNGPLPNVTRQIYLEGDERDYPQRNETKFGTHYLRISNGASSLSGVGTGIAHRIPWNRNQVLTGSFFVRGEGALKVVVIPMRDHIPLFDNDASTEPLVLSFQGAKDNPKRYGADEDWKRVSFTVKPNAKKLNGVEIRILSASSSEFTFDIDGVMIEEGRTVTEYFDGDTSEDCYWVERESATTGYIVEPPQEDFFGYTHASPSAINISVTPNASGLTTKADFLRTEPGAPSVAGIEIGPDEKTFRSFRARWENPNTDFADVVGYEIQVGTTSNLRGASAKLLPGYDRLRVGKVNFKEITGLRPKRRYYYRVRSYNEQFMYSPWSPVVSVITEAQPDMEPPQEVTLAEPLSITSTSFVARWEPTYDNVEVAGYLFNLSMGTPGNFIKRDIQVPADTTAWYVSGLIPEEKYFYSVKAFDTAGNINDGLTFNPSTNEPLTGTYMPVETLPQMTEETGNITGTVSITDFVVVSQSQPGEGSLTIPPSTFTDSSRVELTEDDQMLYVQFSMVGLLAGQITEATLYLHRELPTASARSNLQAQVNTLNQRSFSDPFPAFVPLRLKPITLKVTALAFPDQDRVSPLFNPTELTWDLRPDLDLEKTMIIETDDPVIPISLAEFLQGGLRYYGVRIEVLGSSVILHNHQALSDLRPYLSFTADQTTALSLRSAYVSNNVVVARNLFPNPTLEMVESEIPLRNPTFQNAETRHWDMRVLKVATDAKFTRSDRGSDTYGGSGALEITSMWESDIVFQGDWNAETNTPNLVSGTHANKDMYRVSKRGVRDLGNGPEFFMLNDYVIRVGNTWVRADEDQKRSVYLYNKTKFEVQLGYTYRVSAQIATSNVSLVPILGVRWFENFEDDEPIRTSYEPLWTPTRTGSWIQRDFSVSPLMTGKYNDKIVLFGPVIKKWIIAEGQDGAGTVIAESNVTEIAPKFAQVELYAYPAVPGQTGTIRIDDLQVFVDSGKAATGVIPVGGAMASRTLNEVTPYLRKNDELEGTTYKFTADGKDKGIDLMASVIDETNWLGTNGPQAVVNYMENPSFESNFGINANNKYYSINGGVISRTNDQSYRGGSSLKLEVDAKNEGVKLRSASILDKRKGKGFIASFRYRGTGQWTSTLYAKYTDNSELEAGPSYTQTLTNNTTWVDGVSRIVIIGTRTLEYLTLEIKSSKAQTATIYIDAVQMEESLTANDAPRMYCDGNQVDSGCYWYGAPNESISYRSAFVGHVRLKTDDFDPALETWLSLKYEDGFVLTSPPRTSSVLARWEGNRLDQNGFSDDRVGLVPTGWSVIATSGVTSAWKVTKELEYNRFGPDTNKSVVVELQNHSVTSGQVAELRASGNNVFPVVAGQKVTALATAQTTAVSQKPRISLTFLDFEGSVIGSALSSSDPTLDPNEWTPIEMTATVPVDAVRCRVSLQVWSTAAIATEQEVYFSAIWAGFDLQNLKDNWYPLVTYPIAPLGEFLESNDLVSVTMHIRSTRRKTVSAYVDAPTIQFNVDGFTAFHGATLSADWEEQPFNSPSQLYGMRLTNRTSYYGDSDNSAEIATRFYPLRLSTTLSDRPGAGSTVVNRRFKYAETYIPSILRWNELSNPLFELGTAGWEASSASVFQIVNSESAVDGNKVARLVVGNPDPNVRLNSTNFIPTSVGEQWTASMKVRAPFASSRSALIGGELKLKFYSSKGLLLSGVASTGTEEFDLTVGEDWTTVTVSAAAPAGAATVEMAIEPVFRNGVVSMQPGDVFEFDEMMLYNGYLDRPFINPDDNNGLVFWEGMPHASATIMVIQPGTAYRIISEPFDEDGIASVALRMESTIKTPERPAFYTEFLFREADIDEYPTYVEMTIPYIGGLADSISAFAEYRAAGTDDWKSAAVDLFIEGSRIKVFAGNLLPQKKYILKVVVDSDEGRLKGATEHIYSVVTPPETGDELAASDGLISYGDLILNGPDAKYFWVSSHNSFSLPPLRMQVESLPRRDGAVEMQSYWDRKTITMEGGVWGEDRTTLDKNLKALRAALSERKKRLRIDTLARNASYYTATCSGFNVSEIAGENLTHLNWSATFECADPFVYRLNDTELSFAIRSSDNGLDIETILSNDQTFTVNNTGSVNAQPQITVDAKASGGEYAIVIYNDTTNGRFFPKTTLKAGDALIINTETKTCRRRGATNVDYLGSFLEFVPGVNDFRVSLRSLNEQRFNLLENPSADDDFRTSSPAGPNVYRNYRFDGKKTETVEGVELTRLADQQTYAGSPYVAFVECDGSKLNQGVIFRTPKNLYTLQGWDREERAFSATAAVRTDVTNRVWTLSRCFLRIWFADGSYQDDRQANDAVITPAVATVKPSWSIIQLPTIRSKKKNIDYIELILATPQSQAKSFNGKPVSFYVDDCKLSETSVTERSKIDFDINIKFREKFI